MVDPIPVIIKKVWEHWNIRGVILLSLSMQIFLILFAPLRKGTQTAYLVVTIWSAYLLADYFANFCVGLISNSQLDALKSSKSVHTIINTNSDLLAFWAPFLLLHLGGPDTITALALEDNELWLRHLLGFVSQVATAAYVFMLSMPGNVLWLPTLLVFLAGMIKYGERTYSLYRGSIDTFRESSHGEPNAGPNYPMLMEKYRSWQEAGIPTNFVEFPDRHKISTDHADHQTTEELSDYQVVQKAFYFFNKFKGLIADMIFSFSDRNESRKYFHELEAKSALRVIEVELNFLYAAFYTKFFIVRNVYGFILRLVATISITSALAIFHNVDKEKYGFDSFDVRVTYALLCGAVALDFIAFFMLIFSDVTLASSNKIVQQIVLWSIIMKKSRWKEPKDELYKNLGFREFSTGLLLRRWNGKMSRFDLIKHCLDKCRKRSTCGFHLISRCFDKCPKMETPCTWFVEKCHQFGSTLTDQKLKYLGPSKNPFFLEGWEFIFFELRRKSEFAEDVDMTYKICDARGGFIIERMTELDHEKRESLLKFVDVNEVAFDESLILWHIATHLCCTWEGDEHQDQNQSQSITKPKLISKLISDYMLYLLIFQSKMISAVAGIGIKRYQDTCEEATKFFKKREGELDLEIDIRGGRDESRDKQACSILRGVHTDVKAVDIKGDESKSLLFDACKLAKILMELPTDKRWEVIGKVWVEMLSFAATNCRATAHVQQLSKGGELISLVWLLMVRLGLGKQFQIKEAKLKLIVGTSA